jgi:TRAP-type C4-dicarboxylate transport system permease small subunit
MKKRPVEGLENIQSFLGVLLLLALILVVFFQVLTRYVLHTPLLWSEEAARFLLFWVVLMGAGLSVKSRRHFTLELIEEGKIKSPGWRRVLRLIPDFFILIFGLFMIAAGTIYWLLAGSRVAPNSGVNMRWVFAAIPLSGMTIVIYSLYHVLTKNQGRRGGGDS